MFIGSFGIFNGFSSDFRYDKVVQWEDVPYRYRYDYGDDIHDLVLFRNFHYIYLCISRKENARRTEKRLKIEEEKQRG